MAFARLSGGGRSQLRTILSLGNSEIYTEFAPFPLPRCPIELLQSSTLQSLSEKISDYVTD